MTLLQTSSDAAVKVAQSRPYHSSTELANLNDNAFRKQSEARRAARAETVIKNTEGGTRASAEGDHDRAQVEDRWQSSEWFEPYDEEGRTAKPGLGERDEDDLESVPTPPPIYDLPPQNVPFLAICPAKPPSHSRASSVDTVVEETQEEALESVQRRERPKVTGPDAVESDRQTFTASELMLSLRHGTSFTSSQMDRTSSSASGSNASSLLPHKRDSPFSAHHPVATTLAPATTSFSLSLPAVLEPNSLPIRADSPVPSSQSSTSRSFPISSQASFSALPPPPPLPFSDHPISSQQERQQQIDERNRKRPLASSAQDVDEGKKRRRKSGQIGDDGNGVPALMGPGEGPPSINTNSSSPGRLFDSSPPPSFPFSSTQSSTRSQRPGNTSSPAGKEIGDSQGTADMGESQDTQTTHGDESESQETLAYGGALGESQESFEY